VDEIGDGITLQILSVFRISLQHLNSIAVRLVLPKGPTTELQWTYAASRMTTRS
jgi:hypothetical protein